LKIIRSTKCSTKFTTSTKQAQLAAVLNEYAKTVNFFINHFWSTKTPSKAELLKPVVDLPETWLSARLRKVAAREAIDMIQASKKRMPDAPVKPEHKGKRMCVSSTIANLREPKAAEGFDRWLELRCLGDKVKIDIPIQLYRHFNRLAAKGRMQASYIITKSDVQFSFEIETGPKRSGHQAIGLDAGIACLATLSDGTQFGTKTKERLERIQRCQHGSKGQTRARRALRQSMDEHARNIVNCGADAIVVENLTGISTGTKLKRRLSQNIRRFVGNWNWKYFIGRLQQQCESNRVVFRTVSPRNTSITCSMCGHTDKGNRRSQSVFRCLGCGCQGNADHNAARNIVDRFLSGPYGAGYKPANLVNLGMHFQNVTPNLTPRFS